jgi:hypothetical protein
VQTKPTADGCGGRGRAHQGENFEFDYLREFDAILKRLRVGMNQNQGKRFAVLKQQRGEENKILCHNLSL